MAYPAASGYGNLPNGNWSPVIYSKKVIKFLRQISIVDEITNTEFEGEIESHGDTVRIMKQPIVTVTSYTRGKTMAAQDLTDTDITMVIDQGNQYKFRVNDIEKRQSHLNWEDQASESAAYALKDAYDREVLALMLANITVTSGAGTDAAPVTVSYNGGADFTPVNILARLARKLDEQNVPDDGGRFIVANPAFYEQLYQEDSKLIDVAVIGDPQSVIRARKLGTTRTIHGFNLWKTNNAPVGASNGTAAILAGHNMATATAKNILMTERLRDPDDFAWQYRGLMVYGRKVIRPEALTAAYVSLPA